MIRYKYSTLEVTAVTQSVIRNFYEIVFIIWGQLIWQISQHAQLAHFQRAVFKASMLLKR